MNEQQSPDNGVPRTGGLDRVLLGYAPFFEKALDVIEPPMMKFSIALVVPLLLYLVALPLYLALYFREELSIWGPVLLVVGLLLLVFVILVFFCLVAALWYVEMRFRYSKETEEKLKNAVREEVHQRLEREKPKHTALSDIQITYIEYDPPGDDAGGEFVRIENSGEIAIVMTDWTLHDESSHQFTFPTFTLRPGAYVRIWTKVGMNTTTDLYWGRDQAVWNNEGDCAYLRDSTETLVTTYRYGNR